MTSNNEDPMHTTPVEYQSLLANLFGSGAFRALFALSLIFTVATGLLSYWLLDNQHPYEFIAEQSLIIPNEAQGNDQMLVKWKVRFHRTCPGLIRRRLFDPRTEVILAEYDPQQTSPDAPTHSEGYLNKTFLLPKQIQTGWVGYKASLEYWCNPVQRLWPLRYDTPVLFFKVSDTYERKQ